MPIIKSAKKALRSSKKKRFFNIKRKNDMQKVVKEYKTLVLEGKTKEATALLPKVQQAVDKAEKRGIIKKNNSARKVSRLMKKVNTQKKA